ncbi:hypothetical protein [Streptomyces sp. NPDC001970]
MVNLSELLAIQGLDAWTPMTANPLIRQTCDQARDGRQSSRLMHVSVRNSARGEEAAEQMCTYASLTVRGMRQKVQLVVLAELRRMSK